MKVYRTNKLTPPPPDSYDKCEPDFSDFFYAYAFPYAYDASEARLLKSRLPFLHAKLQIQNEPIFFATVRQFLELGNEFKI